MTITTYASMRSQLPALTVATFNTGSLTGSGTLYFFLQGRNRAGVNLSSASVSASYVAGDEIELTIPATARAAGEDIHYWIISASATNNASTAVQVAIYRGYDEDQTTPRPLPATIALSTPAHIALSATVANVGALPTGANLLNGMLRGVTNIAKILRYDAESTDTVDNVTVFSAAVGRWIQYGSFSTYITNTQDAGGCDQPIGSVSSAGYIQPVVTKDGDGNIASSPVRYWLIANRSEGLTAIPIGKRFSFSFFQNGVSKSQLLSEQIKLTLNGYARLSDGTLDTTDIDTTERIYYYGKTGAYLVEKALPTGYAADWSVTLDIRSSELEYPLTNGELSAALGFYSQSGSPNPIGKLVGDVIYNTGNRRLIVPSVGLAAIALDGSGTVKNFEFNQSSSLVTGLIANTANQVLSINGDGVVNAEGVSPTLDPTEVVRAIVGTVSGVSLVGASSGYGAVTAGDTITLTVTHPIDALDNVTIRASYPDAEIAGLSGVAEFNPVLMRIYGQRQGDSQIREFTGFVPVPGETQAIAISNWTDGTIVGALPSPAANFGLYVSDSPSPVTAAGASDFTTDNYQWWAAYEYTGNQVTTIDHSTGVYTASRTVAEWDQTADEWLTNEPNLAYKNENNVFTLAQRSQPVALSIASGVVAIDCSLSNKYTLTLTEDVTSVTFSNLVSGTNFDLEVKQDGVGGWTVAGWAAAFTWVGGVAPTISAAAGAIDVMSFSSFDGVTIRSVFVQNFS